MVYWKCDNSSLLPLDSDNKSMAFYKNENYRPHNNFLSNQSNSESNSISNFKSVSVLSSNGYYGYVGNLQSNQQQQEQQQQQTFAVKRKEASEQTAERLAKRMRVDQGQAIGVNKTAEHDMDMDVEETPVEKPAAQQQVHSQKNYLTDNIRNNSCNIKCNVVTGSPPMPKKNERNDQTLMENLFSSIHGSAYYQYLNYD